MSDRASPSGQPAGALRAEPVPVSGGAAHQAQKYPSSQVIELRHGSVTTRLGMKPHPADGMTAHVDHGDGAVSSIIDPRSFEDGGPEWVMRYGNADGIRYTVASLLSSYDYLLSSNIDQREAIKRLMLMRRARKALASVGRNPEGGDAKLGSVEDEHAVAPQQAATDAQPSPSHPETQ